MCAFSSLNSAAQWRCSFCGANNNAEAVGRYARWKNEASQSSLDAATLEEWPELKGSVVEWDEGPCDHMMAQERDVWLLMLDTTMTKDDLQGCTVAIAEALRNAAAAIGVASSSSDPLVGLMSFDNTANVYCLDSASPMECFSFPTVRPLSSAERELLSAPETRSRMLRPLSDLLQSGSSVLSSVLESIVSSSTSTSHKGLGSRERGLAGAIEVGAFLCHPSTTMVPDATSTRVFRSKIVFVCGGPPNLYHISPQETKVAQVWEQLSLRMRDQYFIHSIDSFFVSAHACQLDSFLPHLTTHVGGSSLSIPLAPKSACPDFTRALTAGLSNSLRPIEFCNVTLSLYTQADLSITHVIGPFVNVGNKLSRLHLNNAMSKSDCISIYFDHKQSSGNFTLLQGVCRYVNLIERKLIVRVFTLPIQFVADYEAFKSGIDDTITSALLLKRVISSVNDTLRVNGRDAKMQQFTDAIDRTAKNTVIQFGDKFSQVLPGFPFVAFSLRKSLMLTQASDDHYFVLRQLCLRLSPLEALNVLFPRVFRVDREKQALVAVSPETLALRPDAVIAVDSFVQLFVWSGSLTTNDHDLRDIAVESLLALAADRRPAPVLYSFREGDSGSRWVTHQLVPSHKDPAADAEKSFPDLKDMPADARKQWIDSFGFTNEWSFNEWFRWMMQESMRGQK